jgi:Flp pilus assembly protein CpaB
MTDREEAEVKAAPDKYLPARPDALNLRILAKDLYADQPITKDMLQPLAIPPGLSNQMAPGMRSVNVAIPKERAAGGLIRKDERVDVYLTTVISEGNGNGGHNHLRTACIARNLKVLAKHDSLWPVLAPVSEDKPVRFTLETNPYRAALIEFAKDRGALSLMLREDANAPMPPPAAAPSFADPNSKEYRNEDERVAAIVSGDRSVNDADLERIFGLTPITRSTPVRIEAVVGTKSHTTREFTSAPTPVARDPNNFLTVDQPHFGYQFQPPTARETPTPATRPVAAARPTKKL